MGLVLMLAAVLLLVMRRRRRAAAATTKDTPGAAHPLERSELDGQGTTAAAAHEMDSERMPPLVEAPAWTTKHELGSGEPKAKEPHETTSELPADEPVQPRQPASKQLGVEDTSIKPTAIASPDTMPAIRDSPTTASQHDVATGSERPNPSVEKVTISEGSELAQLLERRAKLGERRRRLLELQELDQEEDAVRMRIGELENGGKS